MRCTKATILLTFLVIATNLNAGQNGLTHHSQANCNNNESVSWDATRPWTLYVESGHGHGLISNAETIEHVIATIEPSPILTQRYAASHVGEGKTGGWFVEGAHYIYNENGTVTYIKTMATDCSAYDGW